MFLHAQYYFIISLFKLESALLFPAMIVYLNG